MYFYISSRRSGALSYTELCEGLYASRRSVLEPFVRLHIEEARNQ